MSFADVEFPPNYSNMQALTALNDVDPVPNISLQQAALQGLSDYQHQQHVLPPSRPKVRSRDSRHPLKVWNVLDSERDSKRWFYFLRAELPADLVRKLLWHRVFDDIQVLTAGHSLQIWPMQQTTEYQAVTR